MRTKEEIAQYYRQWKSQNLEKFKTGQRLYYTKNKDRIKKRNSVYRKARVQKDPKFRIQLNLRSRLNCALRRVRAGKKVSHVKDLGCSMQYFLEYIAAKFSLGMTWENYGKEWHLDHIRPLASFNLQEKEEQLKAVHYTNLQPLWKSDNLAKSDTIPAGLSEVPTEVYTTYMGSKEKYQPSKEACIAGGYAAAALGICAKNNLKLRKPILATNLNTGEQRWYLSASHAAKDGIGSRSAISNCVLGKFPSNNGWKFEIVKK